MYPADSIHLNKNGKIKKEELAKMKIIKAAIAGTVESSDVMISVMPGEGKVDIDLNSKVGMYYQDEILKVMKEVLQELDVPSVKIKAVDKGALDCTVRARLKTAIKRAAGEAK